jgi:shikimate kinase/shikimate 5-dehydrogenase
MFFLIGHRGVGKTTLVTKVEGAVDLDHQISLNHDINSYFTGDDEKGFRELERQTLKDVIDEGKASVVALGAGFELSKFNFPKNSRFVWIQRRSDKTGRVFLNRPRLNPDLGPLEEYFSRFENRNKVFKETADVLLEIVEGAPSDESLQILLKWVKGETFLSSKAYYTLESHKDLNFYSGKVELRTDILSELEILSILRTSSENSYLVSVRTQVSQSFLKEVFEVKDLLVDLPLERKDLIEEFAGNKNTRSQIFVSSHQKINSEDLSFCKSKCLHLKWAPVIKNFSEMKKAFKLIADSDVSFLPRSGDFNAGLKNIKWKWIRESLFYKNRINFYRTGMTEFLDQVLAQDLITFKEDFQDFKGAVLGESVFLSQSPGFHRKFFLENFESFYSAIPMGRDEFNKANLDFIKSFGYKFFSVTAPFKSMLGFLGSECSLNTVSLIENKNKFVDTDLAALESLADKLKDFKRHLIWGSGSMGKALKHLLGDHSELMSVRTYKGSELEGFDVLVWCAGAEAATPIFKDFPTCIFDLEYKGQSRAKQVAFLLGTQYVSGDEFFKEQARAQQSFWLKTREGEQ